MPYMEKRNGRPTGHWLVDVVVHGQRHKSRHKSYDEACVTERDLKILGSTRPRATEGVYTLRDLDAEASHKVWSGQRTEEDSVKQWRVCLALLGPDTPVTEVRYPQLEKLVDRLKARRQPPYDNKTVNRYLATVSKILRWSLRAERIVGMPVIPRLPEDEGRVSYLRKHEVTPFLDWLRANERPSTTVCLEVLLATGMRLGEFLKIDPDQIESDDEGTVIWLEAPTVKNKTGRFVVLPDELAEPLRAILRHKVPDEDLLRRACDRAARAIGAKDHITPHVLRHTVGTHLAAGGKPTTLIADVLGHRNLATTRKYVHPVRQAMRDAVQDMRKLGGRSSGATLLGGLVGELRGTRGVAVGETARKAIVTKRNRDLQSAPFAARDIPPCEAEPLEMLEETVNPPPENEG